jgi:hypothetical protein
MTTPDGHNEPPGQRRAGAARKDIAGEDANREVSENLDPSRYADAESALGGADSVQKTSYVTGEGTEPEGAPRAPVIARTSSGGGVNIAAWVIGAVAALIAVIYMLGIFR